MRTITIITRPRKLFEWRAVRPQWFLLRRKLSIMRIYSMDTRNTCQDRNVSIGKHSLIGPNSFLVWSSRTKSVHERFHQFWFFLVLSISMVWPAPLNCAVAPERSFSFSSFLFRSDWGFIWGSQGCSDKPRDHNLQNQAAFFCQTSLSKD